MKRVGDLIRQTRRLRGLSYKDVEELTHIRASFVEAIENSQWNKLPEENIVLGFIKSITHFLDIDERHAVALFRREYPASKVKTEKLKVKNDSILNRRFILGPRVTFLTLVSLIVLVVIVYLGFQYGRFNAPPMLVLDSPVDAQTVISSNLEVSGKTDSDATVIVNNQSAITDTDGNFKTIIEVTEETKEVIVEVKNRAGKTTTISRTITVTP